MTKKITVSVSDQLYQKMEKWKKSLKFSKVFQEAMGRVIENREEFQRRLGDVTTMEDVIQRLRLEKMQDDRDHYEVGRQDGLEWCKAASYADIRRALTWEAMRETSGNTVAFNPAEDEVLGDYFGDIIGEDPLMGFEETGYGFVPNSAYQSWELGWVHAVREFWKEVKDKL